MSKYGPWLAAVVAPFLALSACGGEGDPAQLEAGVVLHRGNAAEPRSLDPRNVQDVWENRIVGDMFVGLFARDQDGEPVPGMAERWSVSPDGRTWTFTLREAAWSDGSPVTADDFVFALRRALDPSAAAESAAVLYPILNAQAVSTGARPVEQLGVRALDPRRLEIRLEHPAPFLPGLLLHPAASPVPAHVVREHGEAWTEPENIAVNGPYKLVEWRADDVVRLRRNALFHDDANVCVDEVDYYPTEDASAAERRVRNGDLDLNAGFPGPSTSFLREQIPSYVHLHPALRIERLVFNTQAAPFDDARVRTALSMAIDRDLIVENVLGAGQQPAYWVVPHVVSNHAVGAAASWRDRPMEERLAEARRLLEAAGFGPDRPLRFVYARRDAPAKPDVTTVLRSNWRQIAPWVDADISPSAPADHDARLRSGDFQVADGGRVVDYDDPLSFLFPFETRAGSRNEAHWSNAQYDDLVTQASLEPDVDARAELLRNAEQALLDEAPIAPLWEEVSRNLVSPRVTGWSDNPSDMHPTRYLCFSDIEDLREQVAGD